MILEAQDCLVPPLFCGPLSPAASYRESEPGADPCSTTRQAPLLFPSPVPLSPFVLAVSPLCLTPGLCVGLAPTLQWCGHSSGLDRSTSCSQPARDSWLRSCGAIGERDTEGEESG